MIAIARVYDTAKSRSAAMQMLHVVQGSGTAEDSGTGALIRLEYLEWNALRSLSHVPLRRLGFLCESKVK